MVERRFLPGRLCKAYLAGVRFLSEPQPHTTACYRREASACHGFGQDRRPARDLQGHFLLSDGPDRLLRYPVLPKKRIGFPASSRPLAISQTSHVAPAPSPGSPSHAPRAARRCRRAVSPRFPSPPTGTAARRQRAVTCLLPGASTWGLRRTSRSSTSARWSSPASATPPRNTIPVRTCYVAAFREHRRPSASTRIGRIS
jgi:hypothetical protein